MKNGVPLSEHPAVWPFQKRASQLFVVVVAFFFVFFLAFFLAAFFFISQREIKVIIFPLLEMIASDRSDIQRAARGGVEEFVILLAATCYGAELCSESITTRLHVVTMKLCSYQFNHLPFIFQSPVRFRRRLYRTTRRRATIRFCG